MKKLSVSILVILAVLSLIVSVMYLSETAGNLPHFFLGYSAGSTHKHTKHAIAFIGLAVVFLLGTWMVSGSSDKSSPATHPDKDKAE